MNKVQAYVTNQNFNISQNEAIKKIDSNKKLEKTVGENIKNKDTIEINEKNENLINTKKAYDAFKEVNSEFGCIENSLGNYVDMSLEYGSALTLMKVRGMVVPHFMYNETCNVDFENNNFVPFMDKMKAFVEDVNKTNPGFFPDKFLEFCDAYKERLIQYGCK